MNQVYGVVLNQWTESFLQAKKAFAGVDGRCGRFLDLLVSAPVLGSVPGTERAHLEEILGPSQFILLEKAGVADGVLHSEGANVVGRKRLTPADGVAQGLNMFAVLFGALGGGHSAGIHPAEPV